MQDPYAGRGEPRRPAPRSQPPSQSVVSPPTTATAGNSKPSAAVDSVELKNGLSLVGGTGCTPSELVDKLAGITRPHAIIGPPPAGPDGKQEFPPGTRSFLWDWYPPDIQARVSRRLITRQGQDADPDSVTQEDFDKLLQAQWPGGKIVILFANKTNPELLKHLRQEIAGEYKPGSTYPKRVLLVSDAEAMQALLSVGDAKLIQSLFSQIDAFLLKPIGETAEKLNAKLQLEAEWYLFAASEFVPKLEPVFPDL